jgi:hypothetical protein
MKIMDKLLEPEVATVVSAKSPAKPRAKERQTKAGKDRDKPSGKLPSVHRWALFGVAFMLVLSAGLNGFANAQHSPVAWAGWLMGLAVPVIVLVLAKVSGEKWRADQKPLAWFAGGSGIALLVLSVYHCSQSIALLTGSPVALAVPLAVAIDCGLVACEIALITEPRTEAARVV